MRLAATVVPRGQHVVRTNLEDGEVARREAQHPSTTIVVTAQAAADLRHCYPR
jgi:hypothetical protein